MAVMLVTGVPGAGKTALVVDLLAHDPQFAGRPLFVMGIPELLLEHEPVPPVAEWVELRPSPEDESLKLPYFRFPANAVVVLDEAQRVYRPRPTGSKVPPEVAAFETHRHTGIDVILLTQHPGLIDQNVRKLISRHWHVHVTALGRYLIDWPRLGDVESSSDRQLAARKKYKPPRRVFSLYKSAEMHTKIKRSLPWQLWLVLGALVLAVGGGWYAYGRIKGKTEAPSAATVGHHQPATSGGKTTEGPVTGGTIAEYHAARVPRVEGLHHTAPLYDNVTAATAAPFPVGCMVVAAWRGQPEKCRCVDQQGNNYSTTEAVCRGIVRNGMFREFEVVQSQHTTQSSQATATAPPATAAAPASASSRSVSAASGEVTAIAPQAISAPPA